MKVFEFCVIYVPKRKSYEKEAEQAKIIVEPKTLLASDAQKANMIAARSIPEAYLDKLDDVEIAIRPF